MKNNKGLIGLIVVGMMLIALYIGAEIKINNEYKKAQDEIQKLNTTCYINSLDFFIFGNGNDLKEFLEKNENPIHEVEKIKYYLMFDNSTDKNIIIKVTDKKISRLSYCRYILEKLEYIKVVDNINT